MARPEYIVKTLAENPWQEQTGEMVSRKKATPVQFWCRLSEDTETWHDGQNRSKVVDHVSVEIIEGDAVSVNGIPLRGSLRFKRVITQHAGTYLQVMSYYVRRAEADGSYMLGDDSIPEGAAKAIRLAMEGVANRLLDDPKWLLQERAMLRMQEMNRLSGKVEEAERDLVKLENERDRAIAAFHRAAEAAAEAVTLD